MQKEEYPELDEYVLATVKKIMPYGAFCGLDEYPKHDGFLHISQVSSGWIRNIREHLREGQKVVVKVTNIARDKQQIDLSLKQVSESDKKRKLESYKAERKARKLIEVALVKAGLKPEQAEDDVVMPLTADHGSAAAGLEALHEGELKTKLPPALVASLKELVDKEFVPKSVRVRAQLKLVFYDSNGVEALKKTLSEIESKFSEKSLKVAVTYLGAPNYFVDLEADDYKRAEKQLDKISAFLDASLKSVKCDYELTRAKG